MQPFRSRLLLAFVSLAAACNPAPEDGQVAKPSTGWYRGDCHFHTNYSEDAKDQGGDDLAFALQIADSWDAPEYEAAFPEHAGNPLDFVVVTDHRTDAALSDPAFKHDRLIVVPGEEYGGRGHATIAGLQHHIPHEPIGTESQDQRHADNQAAAHAQGAIFSINHPAQDNFWPWTVDAIDGVEVWNAPWSAFWGEIQESDLDASLNDGGAENPYIRNAIRHHGGGTNEQGLFLWYGMLTRGKHPAFMGGSDRHMLTMPGHPTTYVRKPDGAEFEALTGHALGPKGIVEGIRAGGTFVSRTPYAAQVVLEAEDAGGKRFPVGADLKAGATYKLHAKVTRAPKGLFRFVGGPVVPGTGNVTEVKPTVLFEKGIEGNYAEFTFEWVVPAGGAWVHATVFEQRIAKELEPPIAAMLPTLNVLPQGKSIAAMLDVMGRIVDVNILQDPTRCEVPEWETWGAVCNPVDRLTLATFWTPDSVDRLLNTVFVDGAPTEWSMGAVTSAFLALP